MRAVLVRSVAVLGIGLVMLAGILYYASTVDSRPPLVESIGLTQHEPGDEQLALTTTTLEVEFNEPVRTASAEEAFRIEPVVDGTFSWSGATMTFTPADRLPLDTDFSAWVEEGVADAAGNEMVDASDRFEFRTAGAPTVVSTQPEDDAADVPLDASIVIVFSSLMDTASVEQELQLEPSFAYELAWSSDELTIEPRDGLSEATRYTVTIGADARDSAGIAIAEPFRLQFRTAVSALGAELLVPADGSEGISVHAPVAALMDREIDAGTISAELISIEPEVSGTLELGMQPGAAGLLDPSPRMLVFTPSGPLQPNTTYRVRLERGPLGNDGSQLAEPIEWAFTTGAPLATLGNQVVFLSDRAGTANLWSMNPDGSAQRQLSSELSPVIDYAVAPDGRSFVTSDGAILVLQAAGGGNRAVLTASDVLEFDPAWAPNGSRFAFGRADRESGAGLGLWTRDASGGDAQQVDLPDELGPGASPSLSGDPDDQPLLRAPRFSPDGAALAFVDSGGGRIGVVELPAARLSTAAFVAAGPPVWLRDSTAILVPGSREGAIPGPSADLPLQLLDASGHATVGIAQLDRGASAVRLLQLPSGSTRPAISPGELLFVRLEAPDAAAGELWLSTSISQPGAERRLLGDGGAAVRSAGFGVEPGTVVAARSGDGIWLVDALVGRGEQLSEDGWMPRWLP